MKRTIITSMLGLLALSSLPMTAQKTVHPSFLTTPQEKRQVLNLIDSAQWASDVFNKLKERTDRYVEKTEQQPDWLLSRLAMYWKTHATDVYIKGESFDHAGGDRAPVPTVRHTGTRGNANTHNRPKLEDVVPYDDDENANVHFINNADKTQEKVHPSKTGRAIESLNNEILGIARDAAFLYWLTGDEKYARLAAGVFDTYMKGIYYRNVPIDLNHGHQQTLVGMSSYEVIHEDALNALVPLYDFLHDYLSANRPKDDIAIYDAAFKKWADNIIDNGVPHNNWDLIQARFIMNIALVLDGDDQYTDRKGRDYYVDYVLNKSSIREWSLKDLAAYGFDSETGIWGECPGYSSGVVGDYANFSTVFDKNLGRDLFDEIPVISKAIATTPQYLFPNGMIVGFGDTHPGKLRTDFFERAIVNARNFNKPEEEKRFTALLKLFKPETDRQDTSDKKNVRVAVTSFFEDKPLELDPNIPAASIDDIVTPTFHAPNVSWLVQRNGMDPRHSLMISQNGSEGNHMHANGISMELYGKGFALAPDAGIGTNLYQGLDYAEYYSQFPSHNTVCVDGISSYPVMKSNHAFEVKNVYPEPGEKVGYQPVSFSEVEFLEPETQAKQNRVMGIINTSDSTGYYVDIFRSRRNDGKDKMHDYFYHNLGQKMTLTKADGSDLNLQPTQELAFAGAHLYGYSYIYDKKAATTTDDVRADFTIDMPDGDDITMTMWMKGSPERTVFSALSPMTEGLSRTPGMPYNIKEQPTLTYVARQMGEAWNRPFVAVFEPHSVSEQSMIQEVSYPESPDGMAIIEVSLKNGKKDVIISSSDSASKVSVNGVSTDSPYTVYRYDSNGSLEMVFLADASAFSCKDLKVKADKPSDILLKKENGKWKVKNNTTPQIKIR